MLQLDLDKLGENSEEFCEYAYKVLTQVNTACLIATLIKLAEKLSESIELADEITKSKDEKEAARLMTTQVIFLTQFWLLYKDTFKKIDRILDHSEDLPMIDFEE